MLAEYAVDHGIPWRRFLVDFTAEDRALIVAVRLEKALICQMCGTTPWEWESDPHGLIPILHVCPGCAHKDRFTEGTKDAPTTPGSSVRLTPRAVAAEIASAPAKRPRSMRELAKEMQ